VVKNVAGYDLMKLMTGSWGSLAVISEVTLRTYPQPAASKTLVMTGAADTLATLLSQLLKSRLTPTGLTYVNAATLGWLREQAVAAPALLVRVQSVAVGVETQIDTLSQWAAALNLTAEPLEQEAEQILWERLQQRRDRATLSAQNNLVTAKVGALPDGAIATLETLEAMVPVMAAVSHGASGLGWVALDLEKIEQVAAARALYQKQKGFFSVMEAPLDWKQSLDIWGYTGNALTLMRRIKQQFDPQNSLSPGRFLV
ncbi:MAG: FAD-binding oxidoreductase, partial [Cyanobacteria bacterium P01_A01_bin.135]